MTRIDAQTQLFGVIGDPVGHSLSPLMHNIAFAHIDYNAAYLAFQVKDIAQAVAGIRGLGICGASVTIPHKVSVMGHLDEIDPLAAKIGAVNTVVNRDGRLWGYNSDCLGALRALKQKTVIKDRAVVILGAGGAARAIGHGIVSEGGHLTILNILEDEGRELARDLGVNYFPLTEFGKIPCEIVINATPVGMTPDIHKTPVDPDWITPDMVVMDIVYNPLKTRFLEIAEQKGCAWVDGVAMFVNQGVAQFEMWTGREAPAELMRQSVLEALA